MSRLIIRGGRVLDPANHRDEIGTVTIENGVIVENGDESGAEVIDATGLVVTAGFVDIHTHLREPGREDKETLATGTHAAAAGGFTTVCPIPNTSPVIDSQTGLRFIKSRAETDGLVRVEPYAAVTLGQKGEEIVEFGDLVYYGARGFTDDGRPVMNNEIMRRALEYSAMFQVPILDHCEDAPMAHEGVIHEGAVSLRLGLKGIPAAAESTQVARDVELAAFTGGHIHIMHVSKKESLVHIRAGKSRGVRVTCEVTPHHLTLTDEAVLGFNTLAKVNPPLGSEEDRLALVEAWLDGTIDCIATDHAPHTDIEKDMPINEAPFGMIGLETAFPLLHTEFVLRGKCDLAFLVRSMTSAPAAVLGFADRGTLSPGSLGDVALLDLAAPLHVTRDAFHSRSKNTPLLGRTFTGRAVTTICGGRVVYRDGQVITGQA